MARLHAIIVSREEWLSTKVLVDRSADIEAKTSDGDTPLHKAAREGYVEIVRSSTALLCKIKLVKVSQRSQLHFLTNGRLAKFLLDRGANIKTKDLHGVTLLHSAACYGEVRIVKVRRCSQLCFMTNGCRRRSSLTVARMSRQRTAAARLHFIK